MSNKIKPNKVLDTEKDISLGIASDKKTNLHSSAPQDGGAASLTRKSMLIIAIISIAACAAILFVSVGKFKFLAVLACLTCLFLLLRKDGTWGFPLALSAPALALTIYLALSGLSLVWAESGKFFLKEYTKLLISFAVYLLVILRVKREAKSVRLTATIAGTAAAILSILSVDTASSGLLTWLVNLIPNYSDIGYGFESGTRLSGIFGNGNVLAGVLSIGIILSVYLVESAETPKQRYYSTVLLSVCAYSFLLAFSMGATGVFAVAVLVYLVAAGKDRGSVLLRMLFTAIPTAAFMGTAFSFFGLEGFWAFIPLICMAANAAISCILEKFLYPSLYSLLEGKQKPALVIIGIVLVLVAAYVAASLSMTAPYTLDAGGTLSRAAYPAQGENKLSVQADGDITVKIESQNPMETMMHTSTILYEGAADGAAFCVPDESKVVYFTFSAPSSITMSNACLATGEQLSLKYVLLPDFISNRLQGLRANENAIQRLVFFEDGLKLFRERPIIGSGLGAFESECASVQNFYYETKYVHDQYIQVLIDGGLLCLIPYAASLLFAAWALWKKRKEQGEFSKLYPALWAALVMICCHSAWEITMSTIAFLPFAFTVLALIALCFADPVGVKKKGAALGIRVVGCSFAGVYLILLCLNIAAFSIVSRGQSISCLETASAIDVFEYNDYKLSYVSNALNLKNKIIRAKADKYADSLMQERSNSIHYYLIQYYLETGNYQKAIEAANRGVELNYANEEIWNSYFGLFRDFYLNGNSEKFSDPQDSTLRSGVLGLYEKMENYNKQLWDPIELESTENGYLSVSSFIILLQELQSPSAS